MMALTQIFNISNLYLFSTKRFPICGAGLNSLSRLDLNFFNLINVSGKKTIAEELGLPLAPKRPLLPFMRFLNQQLQGYSDLTRQERISQISKEWNLLKGSQRAKFVEEYYVEYVNYKAKYNEYIVRLTPEQLRQIKDLALKRKNAKELSQIRKKYIKDCQDFGKPKFAGYAFNFYLKAVNKEKHSREGNVMKFAAEQWKTLSDEAKEIYRNEARGRHKIYLEELSKWESKMKEIGRTDLLNKPDSKTTEEEDWETCEDSLNLYD